MSLLRWAVLVIVMAGFMAGGCIRAEDGAVLRVLAMPEWRLLHKAAPEYPTVALQRHIQGAVRFTALIGKDGRIERLSLISGHPLLVAAAARAAKQWIYRPMTVHGNPVRVSTRIEVTFALDARGNPIQDDGRLRERTPAA